MVTLILLRHGQSEWNSSKRFAGWADIDLTEKGVEQAVAAGRALRDRGVRPDVVHTSVLGRAVRTADLSLETAGAAAATRHRSWRLNERHCGAMQGRPHAEGGEWRRSWHLAPLPIDTERARDQAADPLYASIENLPTSESLLDLDERLMPYWHGPIAADLRNDRTTLVVGHGNSLRVLIRHLESWPPEQVTSIIVPTAVPLFYEFEPTTLARLAGPDLAAYRRPVNARPVSPWSPEPP